MKGRKLILFIFFLCVLINGCTKLHEAEGSSLTSGQIVADTSSSTLLLTDVYTSIESTFTSFFEVFALSELTTDEAIAPTRANNWDDNGSWRVLHEQTWDPNSSQIHDCFKSLGGVIYAATDMLQPQYKATVQQQAEARFLRAFAMYWILDLFDQVPYRDPGENLVLPARVRKGITALNYIISEINAVEADLPDGPENRANKFAAKVLLMKCYLNKPVYTNRTNFSAPDPTDMNMVISLADSIIQSGKYNFSNSYFDNFAPDNISHINENIFTQRSSSDGNYYLADAWAIVLSYPQGGFNGFTTLSDFYNKFEPNDKRRGYNYSYPNSLPNPGMRTNVGFLIGQQYDLNTDDSLFSGNLPVNYTPEIENILPGPNLEMPGIRPVKYPPDMLNYFAFSSPPTNEFVYFRFPDVLLMKAEAILRGGTGTNVGDYGDDATKIVNAIRTDPSRGASLMSNVTLDSLYDERGRELWWENWRRQDMIRFGKFLLPFEEKEYTSDPKYLLFPIPYDQLALDTNYKQNPRY